VLIGGLAELLAEVPADPFTPDVVAVPSRGVERWIAQSLSAALGNAPGAADGVCANVVFPSPGRLVRDALAAAGELDPDEDPWDERRSVWPLLEVIDDCAGEAWCRTLGRHLRGGLETLAPRPPGAAPLAPRPPGAGGRRMAVAQKLAGLYSSYAAERPSMLLDWRAGRDTDGYGEPLAADLTWQAELWRRLRDHIGAEGPAERLAPASERIRREPGLVELPDRLSLFGPTRLATDQLAVLDALAVHRELHLWLPHPSDGLWTRVAGGTEDGVAHPRWEDPTAEVPRHPLVRSLGRDAREMQVRVLGRIAVSDDEHLPVERPSDTLLAALQADLAGDRAPDASHPMADADTSVQVHSCHGRQRQVEVLREVLLGMLADDPTLELRDVIVMCPDIEAYAPLISASFGVELGEDEAALGGTGPRGEPDRGSQPHPGHQLTFRLADRSLRQTNPVLGVAATLLELADSRMTASEVLDLIALPPVRRRFRLDDDAVERIGDWVRRAGVRWGLDAESRAQYGLGQVAQNTWRAGLDRILAGVAMDEDDLRLVGTALPLDDVDSAEIDLAGRLAELLDRVDAAVADLNREQPVEEWVAAVSDALDALVDVPPADAWQLTQARATLTGAVTVGEGGSPVLRLSDVRALLGDRLQGRPTRANFRTGHLTICTMVPMRSVPHRVVCMLGLDDGVFPRGTRVDGDDILAREPRVGERDRRSEDRQLFLDAILAAKERLVILYTGADERTGAERPPAVPLGELLDVLDRTATVDGFETRLVPRPSSTTGAVRDRVLVQHPLQPFDPRKFETGRLVDAAAFSFDRASYDGSRALRSDRRGHRPFLARPLAPAEETGTVSLDSLVRFLEHPVRGFLRERLELRTADEQDEPTDAVPVAPDKLEEWAVGDRMLRAGLGAHTADDAPRVQRARGVLPPGRLGDAVLAPLVENVGALIDRSAGLRAAEPTTLDVSIELPSGVVLVGTVPRVHGERIVRIEYSKLSAKHRIRAWVHLLALCAQWPERDWSAVSVGRGDRRSPVVGSFLALGGDTDGRGHLDDLVAVYRLGLTRPLPVPPKTACAYAERRDNDVNPVNSAAVAGKSWSTGGGRDAWGEFDDADHRLVGLCTVDDLTAAPAEVGAALGDAYADEPHLFGRLARLVWSPLLACEVIR
jgi:exodeoxyribonuclease V gamma subunit